MGLNVEKVRGDFPVLAQAIKGKPIVYFDNACMTLKPQQVIDAVNRYYAEYPACGGRSYHKLGKKVTEKLTIPSVGIGAGPDMDGQVLVLHDMLGITQEFSPRFLRRYHNLYVEIKGAVESYINDVRTLDFPNEKEQY